MRKVMFFPLLCLAVVVGSFSDTWAADKSKIKSKTKPPTSLDEYIARVRGTAGPEPDPGSLWIPGAPFAELDRDYKASKLNDIVIIRVNEQTVSSSNGAVKSARTFSASSGFSGLFGILGPRSGLQTLASPNSNNSLNGQSQTSSSTSLQSNLSAHVVAVLPNGFLVIEADHSISMDNQRQTLTVRGVARPGDIGSDNSIASSSLSELQVEVGGKGVLSDGVRPPNPIINFLLKILEF